MPEIRAGDDLRELTPPAYDFLLPSRQASWVCTKAQGKYHRVQLLCCLCQIVRQGLCKSCLSRSMKGAAEVQSLLAPCSKISSFYRFRNPPVRVLDKASKDSKALSYDEIIPMQFVYPANIC